MENIILYTSPDGETRMHLRIEGDTVWLTQLDIAEHQRHSNSSAGLAAV